VRGGGVEGERKYVTCTTRSAATQNTENEPLRHSHTSITAVATQSVRRDGVFDSTVVLPCVQCRSVALCVPCTSDSSVLKDNCAIQHPHCAFANSTETLEVWGSACTRFPQSCLCGDWKLITWQTCWLCPLSSQKSTLPLEYKLLYSTSIAFLEFSRTDLLVL